MRITFMTIMLLFSICITEIHAETKTALRKELAIVIDDFGNNMKGTEEMLDLPVPITVAVMPFLSTTARDAKLAHKKGHEVIVHLPMEPKSGKKSWLGPGAITTDMSDKEIRKQVEKAIESVPYAVGMNHHMGSKVTEDERVMRVVLEVCKEKGLYYLDSKTSSNSVVGKVAEELSVPHLENDLFFDHIYSEQYINKQANKLMQQLTEEEQLIAIGHVGITGERVVSTLKTYIPKYKEYADIVPLSTLIPERDMIDQKLP
ncbi:divergent polysaccharide deacetylase family protein [Niallia endozanthoxylica]|uniref:Divergent polysaccharide deacetylase family protein n=1 Tax=Niallia endozanthoxylica TaxID=2036016 RepID=A0A5J5HBR3_9BACI|nr:divergent polysaccharide deacetylase family protein [Niallia endozanthoxylica]KAA9017073.1 divergent polysaccharide deacetylase family protein [Niallia endozanthoxylica]